MKKIDEAGGDQISKGKNYGCGMRLKQDAPKYSALPIVGLYSTQVIATVFMNAQVVFLLRTDQSNITEDNLGKKASLTLAWQLIAQMIASLFAGYYFDVLGRRLMIGISYLLIVASLIWTPYTCLNIF
jgi:MFS family permease